jgi:hypothetical protein
MRAVMGYEKVKDWLASGRARVLIQASDGSERGKTKLRPPEGEGRFIGHLTAGEIGLAFGANVRYTPRLPLVPSRLVL